MKSFLFYTMLPLLFAGCTMHAEEKSKSAQGPIYIIHSQQGQLTPTGDGREGMLDLSQVDETVPFVYSHPVRRVGAQRLDEFLRIWAAGGKLQYTNDPPDAHLLYYDEHKDAYTNILIEILHIDGNRDDDNEALSFEIRCLEEDRLKGEILGEVTLFIDCFPFCI
ncbi:MAG: hypothetical protein H7A36_02945 [Chlamydiales bacterium]|nr:hypothetical protein [Chlamydiales bacterium]